MNMLIMNTKFHIFLSYLREEQSHYSGCGGQGGPRERLESIMGTSGSTSSNAGESLRQKVYLCDISIHA